MNSNNLKTVRFSLKAPSKLAIRVNNKKIYNPRYRDNFMRDRDRILYSKAFRRLAGKTQVYLIQSNDHLRTRLTHTLEVAQIAKTIASALKLTLDLTEAIALGHDIGHTPFGHAGEKILHELMTPHFNKNSNEIGKYYIEHSPMDNRKITEEILKVAGFKHNLQSVRVAVDLEDLYEQNGLNLTNFTLYGLANHSKLIYKKDVPNYDNLNFYKYLKQYCELLTDANAWSFEAFIVEQSDEIAQNHHDLEDAIRGNLIIGDEILYLIKLYLFEFMSPIDRKNYKELLHIRNNKSYFINQLSKTIVNLLVTRLIKFSTINLNTLINTNGLTQNKFVNFLANSNNSLEKNMKQVISYDQNGYDEFTNALDAFSKEISTRTISSYDIQRMDAKGQYIIRKLFEAFYNNPQQLPDNSVLTYLKYDEKVLGDIKALYEIKDKRGIGYIRHEFNNLVDSFN
ncbi:MAG: dNTP triphosphohydrolase, partial [Erysipelotrichales bacterium]|nr:dNTP triphosphohydrolase [Erysipelotrichales bacterium]